MLDNDQCLKYAEEEHYCPHCNTRLACCHTPPIHVGDGLGWGTDIFFVCLNDECSLYADGWKHCEEQYGHCASFRFVLLPGEKKGSPMIVGSKQAFTGSEVNTEELKAKNTRYKKEKEAISKISSCLKEKDLEPVLALLLDENAGLDGRHQAADLLVEFNDMACIDPLQNHIYRDKDLEQKINTAIAEILKVNFRKGCPQCAEIIKAQAKVCKHCGIAF